MTCPSLKSKSMVDLKKMGFGAPWMGRSQPQVRLVSDTAIIVVEKRERRRSEWSVHCGEKRKWRHQVGEDRADVSSLCCHLGSFDV